jgi:hypothetical protein
MTLKEWYARQDLRLAWKEFFKSEPGKALKGVLTFLGTPAPTMPPQGVDFIDWNSMVNARREGYYEAVRLLGALCQEPNEAEDLPPPWEQPKTETNNNEGTLI